MKDFIYLVLKLTYNLFRRPRTFFKYMSVSRISDVFTLLREDGKDAAVNRLNELLLGMHGTGGACPFAHNSSLSVSEVFKSDKLFRIITPGHTVFIAKLMEAELKKLGIKSEIVSQFGGTIPLDSESAELPHIVICPQVYSFMPPFYMAVQMEQTVSGRWLSSAYFNMLERAHIVFDYSLENIRFFGGNEKAENIPFYYLPVNYLPDEYADSHGKDMDVLFFGDNSVERRRKILDSLSEDFNIKVVCGTYGEDMLDIIRNSKIVLNLHYYEGALLETTRIYEVLSQNSSLVISERSADVFEDKKLEGIVDFVDTGDIGALRDRIAYWLSHEDERAAKVSENAAFLRSKANDFSFFFMRALLANDIIDFETFYKYQKNSFGFDGERVLINPIERENAGSLFEKKPCGFRFFPELLHKDDGKGEELSLKFLLRKAGEEGLERLIVCRDEAALLSENTEAELGSLISDSLKTGAEPFSDGSAIGVFRPGKALLPDRLPQA